VKSLLTTREAAGLLGVGTTAIKRWADEGVLSCARTAGGHRRFRAGDLERVRALAVQAAGAGEGDPEGAPRFVRDLLADNGGLLAESRLLALRARLGSWTHVTTSLSSLLTEIGLAWERGDISVADEHIASERLARALARLTENLPVAPDAPRALLVCPDGEEHTLGLSMVELGLREAGWRTRWIGRAAPVNDIVRMVEAGVDDALLASASICSADRRVLARWAERVGAACARGGLVMVLGGRGAWPELPRHGVRLHELEELSAFLAGAAARRRRPRRAVSGA
jgi:excisionase family DNA binding protein